MDKKKTVKTISYVMMLSLVGKLMALFREVMLGRAYGTGMEANAFLAASRIPRVFFDAIFASAITMSFIPIFSKYMKQGGKEKAFEFSNVFVTYICLFTIVFSIFGVSFSDFFAVLFANKFPQETLELCSKLLKILFPTMIFTGIAFSFVGILQSLENFLVPAIISVVFNGIIIAYFFGPVTTWGIYGLAVIYVIAWLMQVLVQVPSLHKNGYRFRPSLSLKSGYMKEVGVLLLPVMLSTWVQPFNFFINTKFASGFYEGSGTSAMEYSNNLYTMIIAIFVLSVMNVVFPRLSKLINDDDMEGAEKLTGETLGISLIFVIPMMIGIMLLSTELVSLVFGGNEFDAFSIKITSYSLFYFSLGMIGYTFQNVLSRVYFAARQTGVPVIGAVIAIVANYLLCIPLSQKMDIGGLALASSISVFINGLVLMLPLLKKEKQVFDKDFFVDLVKISVSSAAMGFFLYYMKAPVFSLPVQGLAGDILKILLLVALSVLVYAVLIILFRVRHVRTMMEVLNMKKRGRNEV